MPSNVTMNDGTGSIKAATKQITHDGDSAQVQGVELLIVSGTEDSYTAADLTGGAGAVAAGTPRVTLASDDPAVSKLAGGLPAALGAGGGLKVDGSGTALPISAASLPLPSGASTAAKQPALGTAGTPSADVITIQGVTSMTAVKVDGSGVTQPVSAASLPLPSGAATAALQGGGLPSALGAGGGLKVDGSGTALPVSGTVAVSAISSALPAGTNAIGKLSANSGVDIGDVDVATIAAGANLIGDVGLQPRTSGGLSFSKLISAATTNLTQIKGSAGQIYGIFATNINAAVRYLKVYNAASASVTVGTTVPDMTLPIPANAAGAGFYLKWPQGVAMGTGISIALTTGVADDDTGAVAANELTVHVFYK